MQEMIRDGERLGFKGSWLVKDDGQLLAADYPMLHRDQIIVTEHGFRARVLECAEFTPGRLRIEWLGSEPATGTVIREIYCGALHLNALER
jgi:hypothetical protein